MQDSTASSMTDRPIAVFDTGIGGLPYLEWIMNALPDESYVYIADSRNFPYGELDDERIKELLASVISRVMETVSPKITVIACNTASVVGLQHLRSLFPGRHFVGVVPGVKPAAGISKTRRIGIMSTKRTADTLYVEELIRSFASDCRVELYGDGDIVEFMEYHYLDGGYDGRLEALLQRIGDRFLSTGVDVIVLACTHFLHLETELRKLFEGRAVVIDSRDGVGRQVLHVLAREGLRSAGGEGAKPLHAFFSTENGRLSERHRFFAPRYRLEYRGSIWDDSTLSVLKRSR